MKRIKDIFTGSLLLILSMILVGCIHDYPEGGGADPSAIQAAIELTIDLDWTETEQPAVFTKALSDGNARVVIELRRDGQSAGREEFNVNGSTLSQGKIQHTISFPLHAFKYEIGIWFETTNGRMSSFRFDTSTLENVKPSGNLLDWDENLVGGYANAELDLRGYKGKWGVKVEKEMSLRHAGARFRLLTTDMRDFVKEQIEEIEKGETYYLTLEYPETVAAGFNVFTGNAVYSGTKRKDIMDFDYTYGVYDEIKIVEGFLFCQPEETVSMSLSIQNSARLTIIKSPEFSFDVKRGNLTIVKGAFLSEKITNFLWIDTHWDEEIFIEL